MAVDRVTALENEPASGDEDTTPRAFETAREFLRFIYPRISHLTVPFVSPLPGGVHLLWKCKKADGTPNTISVVIKDTGVAYLPTSRTTVDMRDPALLSDLLSLTFVP